MTLKESKKLKIGDRVGCQEFDEDGIILNIVEDKDKKIIFFDIVFETYGFVKNINHKKLGMRALCGGWPGYEKMFCFGNSLRCPSVVRFDIKEISNEELLELWGRSDLIKYLKN